MDQLSRRSFIKAATVTVAAGGAAAALPAGGASASTELSDRATKALDLAATAAPAEGLVAHVKDVKTGEVSLYVGTREVNVRDRHVAALLFAATKEGR